MPRHSTRGEDGPNFSAEHVAKTEDALRRNGLEPAIMIDASHANCKKDHKLMPGVFQEIERQRAAGTKSIIGTMIESNLVAGNQAFPQPQEDLTYGQSITDKCIDWATTVELLSK